MAKRALVLIRDNVVTIFKEFKSAGKILLKRLIWECLTIRNSRNVLIELDKYSSLCTCTVPLDHPQHPIGIVKILTPLTNACIDSWRITPIL